MSDIWIEILLDALYDSVRLLPFLFLTYLLMEWLEHKTGSRTQALIRRAGRLGPVFGGILGVFPQCGFSAAVANLYAGGLVTAGALTAVFMSTSDEMLPIFISEAVPAATIFKILAVKLLLSVFSGFLLDFILHGIVRKEIRYKNIHTICESEHCGCEEGIWRSAAKHTVKIFLFLFLISLVLGGVLEWVGEERLAGLAMDLPVLGQLLSGILGLIPNCASSVVLTELYLEGVLTAGSMMTGLLVSSGVGILVLCRMNQRHVKQNVGIIGYLYLASVCYGVVIDMLHITF